MADVMLSYESAKDLISTEPVLVALFSVLSTQDSVQTEAAKLATVEEVTEAISVSNAISDSQEASDEEGECTTEHTEMHYPVTDPIKPSNCSHSPCPQSHHQGFECAAFPTEPAASQPASSVSSCTSEARLSVRRSQSQFQLSLW